MAAGGAGVTQSSPAAPSLTPAEFAHKWQGVTTTERALRPGPIHRYLPNAGRAHGAKSDDDAAAPQAGRAGISVGDFGSRRCGSRTRGKPYGRLSRALHEAADRASQSMT